MDKTSESIKDQFSFFAKYFESVEKLDEVKQPLSLDQMAKRARQLAANHRVTFKDSHELLLDNLRENETILLQVHEQLLTAVKNKQSVTPAAEWILDNFYLIDEQIQLGKKYLPKGYSRGLPKLISEEGVGLPRVLEIVSDIIRFSDAHTDVHSLSNFINAYQEKQELTLGELWAIPIMLRFALIDNLKKVAIRIMQDRMHNELGAIWAERIIVSSDVDSSKSVVVLADMANLEFLFNSAFVTEFHKRVHAGVAGNSLANTFLEQKLASRQLSITQLIHDHAQQLAHAQVSAANSINSLRFLSKLDWREFVESVSLVERTLREDSNGIYSAMDFQTRDLYRHQVEEIAKQCAFSENDIARIAVDLSNDSARHEKIDKRASHVGFFLIGKGRSILETFVKVKPPLKAKFAKAITRNWDVIYFLLYSVISLSLTALLMNFANGFNGGLLISGVFSLGILFVCAQSSSVIVNWISTLIISPALLPKMDYTNGIPSDAKTMIAIPTIIISRNQVERIVKDLEVRYLGNTSPVLLFGLLTDFEDADVEIREEEAELLHYLENLISGLNRKYCLPSEDQFFLFHRPRLWNEGEQKWMGHERKRGKLRDLNHLLRGAGTEKFMSIVGTPKQYQGTKYVISLDTDTQLPRDSASKLVGIMEHPLNTASVDEASRIVTDGYGIVQPRVAISLHNSARSLYSKLHENDIGIDPYTGAVSDVYQDVFKEGSYIGKGIYNVDVFEKCLDKRFPDNRILSHDLLEGSYIRCAYASDVQLYEENLSSYIADVNRRHRWIRGDWQIARWIFNRVPSYKGPSVNNPISGLAKWKIFDNLRRSLVPVAMTILMVLGLIVLQQPSKFLIAFACVVFGPIILDLFWNTFRKSKHISLSAHIKSIFEEFGKSVSSLLLTIVFSPYEAAIHLDAIVKALWRILVSKKNRLQWVPSSLTKPKVESISWIFKEMSYCVLAGFFLLAAAAILLKSSLLVLGIMVAASWIIAPLMAHRLSVPLKSQPKSLNVAEKKYLRKLARKTWAFYDHLFTAEDNWLPPDNIQQYPIPVTAHRTSPTNIGITLLANLSAYDFGYITAAELIARTKKTFSILQTLERYKGHFFNWYDTQTKNVLLPRYISTVDSGNFIGYILTLKYGLQELKRQPILRKDFHQGLQDVADLIYQSHPDEATTEIETFKKQFDALTAFQRISVAGWINYLKLVTEYFAPIEVKAINHRDADFQDWISAFRNQLVLLEDEINFLSQWENLMSKVPHAIQHGLSEIPSLQEIIQGTGVIREYFGSIDTNVGGESIFALIDDVTAKAINRLADIDDLSRQCSEFSDVAFDFLYDKSHRLLTIGYNADNHQRDSSYYDLLASEARLAAFVGIAQGKVPQESWFALGRRLTIVNGTPTLMSWSGSMFEYLMPLLVMPSYENTLLYETHLGSVKMQIQFADKIGIPWGVSESCYNVVDSHLTYQYKAFGVSELGFKRGLDKELVIAPYATVMAVMVEPKKAFDNLMRMQRLGYEGKYGFYEAVEYTPSRLPRSKQPVVIQTFMAHHQGMGLLALNFLLNEQPMQRRFQADPQLQTALLLLQERSPKTLTGPVAIDESEEIVHTSTEGEFRIVEKLDTPVPEIQLLSNGNYHVMLTQSGSGFSRWKNIAVTRWREDAVRDHWGTFFYVTDLNTGEFFSTAYHPTLVKGGPYEAIFSQGRAEFRRNDLSLECHTEVVVSPEDDVELRRIRITNSSDLPRSIALTSYSEIVIAPQAADAAHPAFSNLFVQTQIHEQSNAIIATRRARANNESPPWCFSLFRSSSHVHEANHYETDRLKFIGRGNTLVRPKGIIDGVLTNSQGSVLDPVAVIQSHFTLGPGERLIIDYVAGAAASKEEVVSLVEKFQDQHLRNRAFDLSWTYSQVALRQINSSESQAQLFTKIASSILYHNPRARAGRDILQRNITGQAGLWRYSISGDLPIVLLVISDINEKSLITQLIQARTYWELKGISVDLVILNEDRSGYRQVLQEQVHNLVNAIPLSNARERQGAVFVCSSDGMPADDIVLLHSVARVVFKDNGHSLTEQLQRHFHDKSKHYDSVLVKSVHAATHTMSLPTNGLFNNSYGCFSEDGSEYIIKVDTETITPLPWVNVIANKAIGTLVSESGHCYTWFENAQMFRLSPWSNDPVTDVTGELFYIRDDENGQFWSPTPWPRQSGSDYLIKHGFGYTIFEHMHDNILTSLATFVDTHDPVKFSRISIRNQSGRSRKISLISYIEWVLGTLRGQNSLHIVTEWTANGILARNPYNSDFPGYVAFCKMLGDNISITCDRREFLGRNGTYDSPKALQYKTLGKTFGAGLDPCTAMMASVELLADEECEMVFMIGAARERNNAENFLQKYDSIDAVNASYETSTGFWKTMLGKVQVETPDPAINLLANGWLTYQVLSCRFWGRSGFYQSGGAFGFRDQLQDSIALLHTDPLFTREQILKSASRQFIEGDVQHWWHPPTNRGVRTLCSDDFLWLPYATSRYVEATGDYSILQEQIPFITGRLLAAHEESYYDQPTVTPQTATLYDHCKLAIDRALSHKGIHGLPLIGSGDWNDGMNMVGIEGKGESTWLGFFLFDVINRFIPIMDKSDVRASDTFKQEAVMLKTNLNIHGWNGKWYLRAYFDDGQALGVPSNDECKIDSIAQSWSLLSGAGEDQKTVTALDAAYTFLVNRKKSIIQLLDPPFDKSAMNPGYIKGYVPGVRENGGQYTHAAIWLVMAFAQQKNVDRMWSLLEIINPIYHGSSKEKQEIYKVEPYVLAADVYGVDPHTGRGGWTWYTGSAGWMYQLIIESVLGVRRQGDKIEISPCIPKHWQGFKVKYNYGQEQFDIQVNRSQNDTWLVVVNDVQLVDNIFPVHVRPEPVEPNQRASS